MAVDGTMTPLVMRIIGVLDDDIVAEEARSLAGCVRDQRFLLGEFQLERVTQECPELLLDRLGFGLWPGKSEEAVIGIAHIMQPPIRRIVGCLLYTSAAADEEDSVDLGGRRIIKKKKKEDKTAE